MRYLLTSLLCVFTLSLTAQYTLSIEESTPVVAEGTTYRVYVNMMDPTDRLNAVFGNSDNSLMIYTPDGIFNSQSNNSWSASGINPAFLSFFPDLADDSFGTIGLTGPASASTTEGALDPLLVDDDPTNPVSTYFTTDGATLLFANNFNWYVLSSAGNILPDSDMRVLVLQLTTTGTISGTINFRVLPLGDTVNHLNLSAELNLALGCTNPNALNYNPDATEDDGSCVNMLGCMDSTSCNYNPEATEDDGSCDYSCCPGPGCCGEGTYWDDFTQECLFDGTYCSWQPDSNADGLVGVTDLLNFLSVFGDTDYDGDGVFDSVDDCVDPEACNYANDPSEPCAYIDILGVCGGGCEVDGDDDGICDSEDDCVGVLDECGVCNGPGPTEIVIESITILYDSVYAEAIDNWFVFEIGADTVFNYTCAPYFGDCGDLVSHEGYDYSTVLIGDQCWFAENCRYLPEVSPSSEGSVTDPYYYVYGYEGTDVTAAQATDNYATYGVLYNWPAVMTAGVCPSGWHVPSDGEFTQLTDFLGGESVAGGKMKDDVQWNGSNSSGWTGLPGGYRDYSGGFSFSGYYGYWWSASESGSYSWRRVLIVNLDGVYRDNDTWNYGFSARCVRD